MVGSIGFAAGQFFVTWQPGANDEEPVWLLLGINAVATAPTNRANPKRGCSVMPSTAPTKKATVPITHPARRRLTTGRPGRRSRAKVWSRCNCSSI